MLRFVLALSVAYGHAGMFLGFPLVPGDTAVQAFYAISGFYMALVLNEKYRPDNSTYLLFLGNRFTRLFPAYAITLIATLILALVVYAVYARDLPFVAAWRLLQRLDVFEAAFLVGTQTVMLGQEFVHFLALKDGAFSFIAHYQDDPQPLLNLLVIPPAWTLGIELSFYLVAPFLVRHPVQVVAGFVFASLALRLVLQFAFGLSGDPWSYRFFPSELALFLTGAIGYRVYRSLLHKADSRLVGVYAVTCLCVAVVLLINRWHGITRVASVGLLLLFVLAIPYLFRATKSNFIDGILGELSYPIYICHFLVIWTASYLFVENAGVARGLLIIATTLLLSGALYWGIDRPIDNWRHSRLKPRPATGLQLGHEIPERT